MMYKKLFFILAGIILLAVVGGLGFIIGHRRGYQVFSSVLLNEAEGNVAFTMEQVARVRTGDHDGAIELMELRLDAGLMSLPQGKSWEEIPESVQKMMIILKAYRTKFPSEKPAPGLVQMMEMIPEMEEPYEGCSEALVKLLAEEPAPATAE